MAYWVSSSIDDKVSLSDCLVVFLLKMGSMFRVNGIILKYRKFNLFFVI